MRLAAVEIGEVLLTPQGVRLRIDIDEAQPYTFWSIDGARAAIAYLQAWVGTQAKESP